MGCRVSQVRVFELPTNINNSVVIGFDQKVQQYIEGIVKQKLPPTEDLKNNLAYFLNNEIIFSIISKDKKLCSQQYYLIKEGTQKLLDCIPSYIQSNLAYAFSVSKILSMFSLILFAFYSNENNKRKLNSTEQDNLIQQIEKIEELFTIEMENNSLSNNIQFYLFFIKSAIAVTPTDSKEGEEILKQFGKGLFNSLKDFSIDGDLIKSLGKGIIYIFKEYKLSRLRRKFKVLFFIDCAKIYVLSQLDKSNNETTLQQLMEPLQQLYLQVINESQDWEIWCFWIQTISDIFSYKRKYNNSERKSFQLLEQSENVSIINDINDDEFVIETNWKMAKNKKIQDDILIKNPIYNIQASLLIGNKYLEGYEQIYLKKITQEKKNNENLIQDSLIIKNINFLTHIKGLQQSYLKLNEIEFTQAQVQQQIDLIQDLITKVSQLEMQLQEFVIWEEQFSINQDRDIIIEPQIGKLIYLFAENYEAYQKLFQGQKKNQENQWELFYNQINKLFEKEFNQLWLIINKNKNKEKVQNQSIENLKQECNNINKESKYFELTQDQLKTKIAIVIKIIFCTFSFLRLNISILQNNQVQLKAFQVKQNDQYFKILQQNQKPIQLLTLFDYQLTNKCLQVLYQLAQQIELSEHKKIKKNRIKSKLKIIIEGKLSMFDFQYQQFKEIVQFNQDKMLQKVAHEFCVIACQNIKKYLAQLVQGLKFIQELIEFENTKENELKNLGQKVLVDEKQLQNLEEFLNNLFDQHPQNNLSDENTPKVKKTIQEIEKAFNSFFTYVERYNQELNSQESQLNKDIELIKKKFQKLKIIEKCLLVIQSVEINKEYNISVIQEIIIKINQQIQDIYTIKLTINNIRQIDFKVEIEFFKILIQEINNERRIQLTLQKLNKNLIGLTHQLVEEKEIYKITSLKDIIQDTTIEQYQNRIYNYKESYQIHEVTILQDYLKNREFPQYPQMLESEIYFLLDQIGSQEVSQEQQNIYDKYKEKITDIIDQHQWRVRQTIVYSLLQIQDRCLQEESFKIVSGLLVKFSVLETDKRIKQLFKDQKTVQEMDQLTKQYWPTQEESIQKIIKKKLKELDALGMQISSELLPDRKKALIKQYTKDQDEINNQIKNIESISSSLGITVLFLQDLKNNLHRIENQLQELQDSINEIGQNIKYLMGRPFIDLFEIRMNKVLDQAQIFNAEKVYVPIKTREKNFNEEKEEEEAPLFTEDIIGEGEINEFLLQQKKNSLLIHGVAGSGKSTAARKIEEFLWDLYQKAKLNTESIPNLPIFISLPQLKDPLYYAVEETLRSDNYRFNERHIEELKEAIKQGKYRIIIIMDSYDELKQDYLESNLNITNKLSKWKSEKDTQTYPKIITTSRTEVFTVYNYYTWFMPESKDIKYYKEIQLVKFNELQTQEYFKKYQELSKKKIIREHSHSQDIISFEKKWRQEKSNLQIEKFIKKDQINLVKQLLSEQWTPQKFQDKIQAMNLKSFLETPFMLEIVVIVLPQIVSQKKDKLLIKDQFIEKYQKDSKESLKIWNTLNEQQYDTFWSQYFNAFTEEQIKQVIDKQFKEHENFEQISNALIQQPLTSFDFYLQFFQHYFDRESQKLMEKGQPINMKEIWKFTQSLAVEMTFHNISSVQYEQISPFFKEDEDWRDKYFDDNGKDGLIKRKLRKCMPLNQKNNIYSFHHKSLQEFLVAKWFIENFKTIEKEEKFINKNWGEEYLQGSVRFVSEKLKSDKKIQENLFNIIKKSEPNKPASIQSASNSIHLLNQMNYVFQNKDLRNIVLENVNLSGINFYKTNLSNSNFTNVNISYCNFSEANLTAVKWENTKLNEMGKLKLDAIQFLTFFDENCIIVFHRNPNKIKCYNPNNFVEINDYHFSCISDFEDQRFGLIKLNQNGLAILNTSNSIYIVDYKDDQIIGQLDVQDNVSQAFISEDENDLFLVRLNSIKQIDITIHLVKAKQLQSQQHQNKSGIINEQITNNKQQILQNNQIYKVTPIEHEIYSGCLQREVKFSYKSFVCGRMSIDIKSKQITEFTQNLKYYIYLEDARNSIVVLAIKKDKRSHVILLYHQSDLKNYKQLEGHKSRIKKLFIIRNGERLLSYDKKGNLIYWNLLECQKLFEMNLSGIKELYTHNKLLKFYILRRGYLEMWDIEQSLMKSHLSASHQIFCCALSYNDLYAITGSKIQSSIIIWDLLNGKQFGKLIAIDDIHCLQFSVDSRSFFSSTLDGYIYQWELATQKQLTKINNFNDCIEQIYSIDQNRILTLQSDKLVKLWNLSNNTFQLIYNHESNENVEQFSFYNTNEYYQRSKNYPFVSDVSKLKLSNCISIQRSKLEVQLTQYGIKMVSGAFSSLRDYISKRKKMIVQNFTIFSFGEKRIIIHQPSEFERNKSKDRIYPIMVIECQYNIKDVIYYQDQLIYLLFKRKKIIGHQSVFDSPSEEQSAKISKSESSHSRMVQKASDEDLNREKSEYENESNNKNEDQIQNKDEDENQYKDSDEDEDWDEDDKKQILEFRKLDEINKIYSQIDLSEKIKEQINCFDVNEDIVYFGGMQGTMSAFDINLNQRKYSMQPHSNKITQIKYLAKHQSVLTVSEDAKIILSKFDQTITEEKEEGGQPVLFLSVSNDENQFMIGTRKSLSLYFIGKYQKIMLEERFEQFENIKFLFVDFENFDILVVDGNIRIEAHISLKRIIKSLQNKFNHKPSQICYNNESDSIYIADDYGGINCWDLNGKKIKSIKKYTTTKNEIRQFMIHKNKIFTLDDEKIIIYDLNQQCKQLDEIPTPTRQFSCFQILNDGQLIFLHYYYFQLHNTPKLREIKMKVRGSDKKKNLFAIYDKNFQFNIYNLERLSLQYNFSHQQELFCDNANIKDAIIKNSEGLDIKPIFFQKNAYEQEVPQNQK